MQKELKSCEEAGLTDLTYAASNGNVDTVEHLLARGLPIDAGAALHTLYFHIDPWDLYCRHTVLVRSGHDSRMALFGMHKRIQCHLNHWHGNRDTL